jgi:hypothetical protein
MLTELNNAKLCGDVDNVVERKLNEEVISQFELV